MTVFDIRDYGAVPDSAEPCTEAVQRAIDASLGVKSAQVLVSGGKYTIGTIFLHSDMDLHIDIGAALVASPRLEDYPDPEYDWFPVRRAPRQTARCLIFAGRCRNLSISGRGTIHCNGGAFCRRAELSDTQYEETYERVSSDTPARMVFCMSCENLSLCDFTMLEMAGGWGFWINDCTYVDIRGITLRCNRNYPNADGIHINCSSDVTVSDCVLHTGDDCLILRANCNTLAHAPRACERVTIKGCICSSKCVAVRVGWRGDFAVRDCLVSDIVVDSAWSAVAVDLPEYSSPFDVGEFPTTVENVRFENFLIRETFEAPITIRVAEGNPYGAFRDISFSGFDCRGSMLPEIWGREDALIRDVRFDHCVFRAKNFRGPLPMLRHCENVTFDGCSFSETSAPPLNWKFESRYI